MKIVKNPNTEVYNKVSEALKDNDGYCPCVLIKNADTKCICKSFIEQQEPGECHCGRYVKVADDV